MFLCVRIQSACSPEFNNPRTYIDGFPCAGPQQGQMRAYSNVCFLVGPLRGFQQFLRASMEFRKRFTSFWLSAGHKCGASFTLSFGVDPMIS